MELDIRDFCRLVFIDGPTGAGKDYFIDKFTQELTTKVPSIKYTVVRATDVVLSADTETENRKYVTYNTDKDKRKKMFLGHLKLLSYLHEKISNNDADVIIINRSFLSYLIYNIYPAYDEYELGSCISTYVDVYERLFNSISCLFINLTVDGNTIENKVDIIVNRLKERNDDKPIDTEWLKFIVKEYSNPDPFLIAIHTYTESITSDVYSEIVDKYFL